MSVEHTFPLHSKFAVADRYVFSFSLFLNFAFVKCFKCLLVYSYSGFVIHLNYFLEQHVLFVTISFLPWNFAVVLYL